MCLHIPHLQMPNVSEMLVSALCVCFTHDSPAVLAITAAVCFCDCIAGIGVSGVAQDVSLMCLKIFGSNLFLNPVTDLLRVFRAWDYAVQNGAHIINNAWSFSIVRNDPSFTGIASATAIVLHQVLDAGVFNVLHPGEPRCAPYALVCI